MNVPFIKIIMIVFWLATATISACEMAATAFGLLPTAALAISLLTLKALWK